MSRLYLNSLPDAIIVAPGEEVFGVWQGIEILCGLVTAIAPGIADESAFGKQKIGVIGIKRLESEEASERTQENDRGYEKRRPLRGQSFTDGPEAQGRQKSEKGIEKNAVARCREHVGEEKEERVCKNERE